MNCVRTGKFIAERRKKLSITQNDIAKALGISDKAVSKWERGLSFPDIAFLGEIANLLKCSVSELTDGNLRSFKSSKLETEENAVYEPKPLDCDEIAEINYNSEINVSPLLFGDNLEHTRACVNGGISAQMFRNRKFAGKPCRDGCAHEWYRIGEKTYMLFEDGYTKHAEDYHMNREFEQNSLSIVNLNGDISGIGQKELYFESNTEYEFRTVLKTTENITLYISLKDVCGTEVFKEELTVPKSQYLTHTKVIKPNVTGHYSFELYFFEKATVNIGALSLMNNDNFRGMRKDVIECMKKIGIKLLRWPGGNFSGEYNWKDGLLPVDMRSPFQSYLGLETQPHTFGYDFHEINTDDFCALCKEIGCEPFITINPAWNTPKESRQWVEYCNGDENTEYGKIRIERGYKEPYNVQFWSLGNEFGYGHMEGENSPYGYSKCVMEHGKEMLKVTPNLTLCSSGRYPKPEWVIHSGIPLSEISTLISYHDYPMFPKYEYPGLYKKEYEKLMNTVDTSYYPNIRKMYELIKDTNLSVSFDEWNSWYSWYRADSVTDGLFAASVMHFLIEESDRLKISVACYFESVNEGAIDVNEKEAKLSATGKVFSLMNKHAGGKLCFASRNVIATEKEDVITVTLLNRAYDTEKKFTLSKIKGQIEESVLYTSESVLPYSDFEEKTVNTQISDEKIEVTLPAHSIMYIKIRK